MRPPLPLPLLWLAVLGLGCTDAQAPAPVPDPRLQNVILFLSNRSGGFQLHVMAPDGSGIHPLFPDTNLIGGGVLSRPPAISPDGRWIAFSMVGDIWVARADGTEPRNLTQAPGYDTDPAWAPDGQRIAFSSDRDGDYDIYLMNPDGSGLVQLTDNPGVDRGAAYSPEGSRLAFESEQSGNSDIYVMSIPDGTLVNLTRDPAYDYMPAWSNDGSQIAFGSTRGEGNFLYLMDADGSDQRPLLEEFNAGDPTWSPGDSLIAFDGADDIWTIRPDGTGLTNLSPGGGWDFGPRWAPK
ncbi:MAG TPA: hypothetical protein PKA66_09710 [Gemmatimonadales bacterium]|nr:hypothetical protein [Gemmatimonadales bacterium]